jgi:hypothetical protein
LKGVVTNNSNKLLTGLRFTVTILDCPPKQECRVIGQESVDTMPMMNVPVGQTRAFSSLALKFKDMPVSTNKQFRWELIEVTTDCEDCWASFSDQ